MNQKKKIEKKIPFSESLLGINIFSPIFYSMIKIGEESGVLDEILDKTADFYDEELDIALVRMTAKIEPIMIIIMGFIIIVMYMPIFDITQTVR